MPGHWLRRRRRLCGGHDLRGEQARGEQVGGAIDKVGGLRGLKPKRRGRLCGIVFAGKFTAPVFAAFLQRLRLFRMPGYGPELNP